MFELGNSASKRDKDVRRKAGKKFNRKSKGNRGKKPARNRVNRPRVCERRVQEIRANPNSVLAKKMFLEHAHGVLPSDVNHLLKTGLLEKMLGEQQYAIQLSELEEFKKSIGKNDGLYAYGFPK